MLLLQIQLGEALPSVLYFQRIIYLGTWLRCLFAFWISDFLYFVSFFLGGGHICCIYIQQLNLERAERRGVWRTTRCGGLEGEFVLVVILVLWLVSMVVWGMKIQLLADLMLKGLVRKNSLHELCFSWSNPRPPPSKNCTSAASVKVFIFLRWECCVQWYYGCWISWYIRYQTPWPRFQILEGVSPQGIG